LNSENKNWFYSIKGDRATGFGVALLNNIFAESHTNVAFRRISANDSGLPLKNETQSDNDD
jgi:hypothetical protein